MLCMTYTIILKFKPPHWSAMLFARLVLLLPYVCALSPGVVTMSIAKASVEHSLINFLSGLSNLLMLIELKK